MKWFVLALSSIFTLSLLFSILVFSNSKNFELDIIEINAIVKQIEENWPNLSKSMSDDIDYTFVQNGKSLNQYITNRDTFVDVFIDGQPVGKVVFFNNNKDILNTVQRRIIIVFYLSLAMFIIACTFFALYQYATIIRPFKRLETFAGLVAQGNLDIPLDMDRKNRFGAFSESFDIMREQLVIARENERLLDVSKKELVASLSHDIKTPISSIKAIAELYQAKYGTSGEMSSIIKKADQIDLLISNMFTATLEELRQLKISPEDMSSTELKDIILLSDYQGRIRPFDIPECIVSVDRLRIKQVIDNILGNSYKYADTDIEVTSCFSNGYKGIDKQALEMCFKDFGPGVPDNEINLLCEKFYRARNAEGKGGSGLGLYLAKYFIDGMGGGIRLENDDGLSVYLYLEL